MTKICKNARLYPVMAGLTRHPLTWALAKIFRNWAKAGDNQEQESNAHV
jgi:hypothetical protein